MLPAASYRRPAFEPINLADADFGLEPATTSARSDLLQNGFVESVVPEEIAPLLNIDFSLIENEVDHVLDVSEYQYESFNSNVPPEPFASQEPLRDFRPDLLGSYDSAKENDKNHSIDNVLRLPDVASCPVLITSPDSSKDDSTLSSEIQSLNTSEICDIDSTNADYSDVELYKCLQEYEEHEDLLSVNCNGSSLADIITPNSELTDELIAEKPLICDDSISETKDTISSETSNDLLLNNDEIEPQENKNKELLLTEEEKVILEEIFEDSSNVEENIEEVKTTDEELIKELEEILEATIECKDEKDKSQKDLYEYNDIPDLPIVPDSSLELESKCNEPIQIISEKLEDKSFKTDCNSEIVKEDDTLLLEKKEECVYPTEKEPTDSLCSIESTETILLKDDNQASVTTITDSLDSQSTCSLPSEVIGDTLENSDDSHLQRPSTLDLNVTTNCVTELPSTLSTGIKEILKMLNFSENVLIQI